MGRAKANMELIKKEKVRNARFQTRKNCLKKKLHELTTLCGIKATVIIYGPKQDTAESDPPGPEFWPENRDEVHELIKKYKGQSPDDRKKRTSLLSDFFQERNKKAQQALGKLRDANVQSKYPTWDSRFSSFLEEELRRIADFLENSIGNAKAKLEQMKFNNSNNIFCAYYLQQQQQHRMLTKKRSMNFEPENQANKYLITIEPHQAIPAPMSVPIPIQQQRLTYIDHYQNQRMLKFSNDYAGSASNIVYDAPPSKVLYNYPTMAGSIDSISYVNNLVRAPPMHYSEEGMQPIAQHYMEYHPMIAEATSHEMVAASLQADAHDQYYEDRKWQR